MKKHQRSHSDLMGVSEAHQSKVLESARVAPSVEE